MIVPASDLPNIPVRVVGWDDGGGAKVEVLSNVPPFVLGTSMRASLRPVPIGRPPVDFTFLKKQGLRTGGIVLLRKAADEGDGVVSAKSVETLLRRESDGLAYVLHGAAVSILPPPPGTAMVNETLVAMLHETVKAKAPTSDLASMKHSLTQACLFGRAGVIFTGEDSDGEALEVVVGGDASRTADELIEEFVLKCPTDIMRMARTSKKSWYLVPFFRGEVDPDRSSRFSAQKVNFDYGTPEEPLWTKTNGVMRSFSESWLVSDGTPIVDKPGLQTSILLDLIEG